MSFEEYADLADTGFQGGSGAEKIAPEDEFYHSVYIAGKSRKNHINITEEGGKLQVRGVQYNMDTVYMIITHTKEILCKVKNEKGNETIECFSFKDGALPWVGTNKVNGVPRQCPQTSAERALDDFCAPCRAQIIVGGIYCKEDGTPILTEDGKPIFVFIRGKGMRYSNVSNYLSDCYQDEFDPLFEPVTDESKEFEKRVVNNKRCVTKILRGEERSQYGSDVSIFVLEKGTQLPNDSVMSILKLSKQTVSKFNEKFDWSKGKGATGYGSKAPEGVMTVDAGAKSDNPSTPSKDENVSTPKAENKTDGKTFSFDDINF